MVSILKANEERNNLQPQRFNKGENLVDKQERFELLENQNEKMKNFLISLADSLYLTGRNDEQFRQICKFLEELESDS